MITLNKNNIKKIFLLNVLLLSFFLTFSFTSLSIAKSNAQRVFQVCECEFPVEIGAFNHLKVIKIRYVLFHYAPFDALMVREIFAERQGDQYRILSIVGSTETSSVGKEGPVIEIIKWNDAYWPGKIIYQLSPDQIYFKNIKMNEKR